MNNTTLPRCLAGILDLGCHAETARPAAIASDREAVLDAAIALANQRQREAVASAAPAAHGPDGVDRGETGLEADRSFRWSVGVGEAGSTFVAGSDDFGIDRGGLGFPLAGVTTGDRFPVPSWVSVFPEVRAGVDRHCWCFVSTPFTHTHPPSPPRPKNLLVPFC